MEGSPIIGLTIDMEDDYYRLRNEYVEAVVKAGGLPILLPPQETSRLIDLIDGLIIPGGKDLDPSYYNENPHPLTKIVPKKRSNFELSLMGTFIKTGRPILGICYGMQLINIFLGGTLYQDIKSQMGDPINHGDDHIVFIRENPFFSISGSLTVNSSHHQAIKDPGKGIEVFATSEDGVIEALYLKDHPFLVGIQWHPERDLKKGDTEKERYAKLSQEIFGVLIERARERSGIKRNGA